MAYLNFKKTLKVIKICLPALIKSKVCGQPLWVFLYLTRKCNLNCKYCYVKDNKIKDMTTAEVFEVINKLHLLGVRSIAFFGGEPTLRKDFCEILNYANKKGFFTFFTTNGTLLDKAYVDRIAKTGVDIIELSVDSIFDFDASKKVYSKSKKVLDLLIGAKKKYSFGLKTHLVLTKKNVDYVVKTIELIHSYGLPLTIGYINRNTYNDLTEDETLYFNDEKSKKKLISVLNSIIKLKKQGFKIMDPIEYFEGMKDYVNGNTVWNCKAGKYFFSVDCDGSIQLCAGLKPYAENVLLMGRDFFKSKQEEISKTLAWCTKKCYANCSFTATHLMNHPIRAILGK